MFSEKHLLDTNPVSARKTPCQQDSCGMNLENVSQSITSDKNRSSKNSDEINNARGKSLLDNKQENTRIGRRADVCDRDGKSLSHNEDLPEQEETQTLRPPFEDKGHREAFANKAAVVTPKRAQAEEKSCNSKEYGGNISHGSTLEVHQETHTSGNHPEGDEREKSTLFTHQKVNRGKKTHESNENENDFHKKLLLTQLHTTHRGEKLLNVVFARKLLTRSPVALNIKRYTQERTM